MIRILILFFIVLQLDHQVLAQKEHSDHVNTWFYYLGNHKLGKKWGIHSDFQYRRSNFLENKLQVLGRIGVEYYSKEGPQYAVGYAFSRQTINYNSLFYDSDENRLWQQMSISDHYGRISMQHRYRLEQRFLEKWKLDEAGELYIDDIILRHRMRYRLMLQVPINKKEMMDRTLFINLFDEIMLGFGKGIDKNILDQNRIYIGLGWRFNSQTSLQIGYQNQYVPKSDGIQIERNHILQAGLSYSFRIRQKK